MTAAAKREKARYVEWHRGWSLDGELVAREFYRYFPNKPDEVFNTVAKPELQDLVAEHARLLRANPATFAGPGH